MKALIHAIRQPYLDAQFGTGNGSYTRLIERPGLWMTQQELDALSSDLRAVAGRTLEAGALEYGVFAADRSRMNDSIITVIYSESEERPVAFNALAVINAEYNGKPTKVLHLGLVMVDPQARSQGFSWILYGLTCLILFIRSGLRPLYISNVTQVPAIIGMVAETFSDVHPVPGAGPARDFAKVQIARSIMTEHRHVFGVGPEAEFDEQNFIIRNAYTGGSDDLKKTFEVAPKHRDEAFNVFCRDQLDYDRGDDFLQIGTIDIDAMRRYVTKSVPRRSLANLAALTALVLLRRAVLPFFYWLDDSRAYGSLRPWKT
ncbi:hypothetical protein [uncultured Roseibium sp.]|uniref:hypothetical protein n=1 Tax=uncultured Roseibium sp. TaxID=1936171 RepID=UPI00261A2937|nr:hypothetical protein [uncultured Roseibium sp.]